MLHYFHEKTTDKNMGNVIYCSHKDKGTRSSFRKSDNSIQWGKFSSYEQNHALQEIAEG